MDTGQGEWIVWEPPVERQRSRIAVLRPGSVYDDEGSWNELREWMIQKFLEFRKVFTPRLKQFIEQEQENY